MGKSNAVSCGFPTTLPIAHPQLSCVERRMHHPNERGRALPAPFKASDRDGFLRRHLRLGAGLDFTAGIVGAGGGLVLLFDLGELSWQAPHSAILEVPFIANFF